VEGNAENLNENSHSPAQVEIAIFLIWSRGVKHSTTTVSCSKAKVMLPLCLITTLWSVRGAF